MSTSYELDYNQNHRLLRIKLNGLWDEAVLNAFIGEVRNVRAQVERAGLRDDNGRILIDMTNYLVQPRSLTEGIAGVLPALGDRAGRVAIVQSASALQNLQIQRLLQLDKIRWFRSVEDALLWLRA